jgi:hypothetical protein
LPDGKGEIAKSYKGAVNKQENKQKEFSSENSSLIEELEYTEPPKETFDCKAKTYAKIGLKYTAPERTLKQKEAWDTEQLAVFIKDKAKSILGIDIFLNKSKSSAHTVAIRRIINQFGLEEGKKMAGFYLNSPKCQEHGPDPSTMFSDHSINLYQASKRKIKSYR